MNDESRNDNNLRGGFHDPLRKPARNVVGQETHHAENVYPDAGFYSLFEFRH